MMSSKEVCTLKQRLLAAEFGNARKAREDNHTDDRTLFCGVYDQIMEACEAMKEVENVYIHVAFNAEFSKSVHLLTSISRYFRNR